MSTILFASVFPNLLFVSILDLFVCFLYLEVCSFDGDVVSPFPFLFSFMFFKLLLIALSKDLINIQFLFNDLIFCIFKSLILL